MKPIKNKKLKKYKGTFSKYFYGGKGDIFMERQQDQELFHWPSDSGMEDTPYTILKNYKNDSINGILIYIHEKTQEGKSSM